MVPPSIGARPTLPPGGAMVPGGCGGDARLAPPPVPAAEQLVGDPVLLGSRLAGGVARHHQLALVHLAAVDQAGVLRGPGPAPATRLDLDLGALVGQLEEADGAGEEPAPEV